MNGQEPNASRDSDFNVSLKAIAEKARELESMCERFLEHHGTDCDCVVCSRRILANITPGDVVEEVAFARKTIRRHLEVLNDGIIPDLPELDQDLDDLAS